MKRVVLSIAGIAVYRGTTAKNMKLLKRIKKTSVKYVDTKAKAGTTYYYTLRTYTKKRSTFKYKNKLSRQDTTRIV
ncbi:MAG: hypothetical protein IJ100_11845 [Lachnospiraceae bacterium]|nr:hypothetical protein [Lachnospiraceae bacterium]